MKKLLLVLLVLSTTPLYARYVNGYYKQDGSYVNGYHRSDTSDNNPYNNYGYYNSNNPNKYIQDYNQNQYGY